MSKKSKYILFLIAFIAIIVGGIVGAYFIAKSNVKEQEEETVHEGEALLTVEYASEQTDENSDFDARSKATIIFYDDHICVSKGIVSGMYEWSYTAEWSVEGGLSITDVERMKAECTDPDLQAVTAMLMLENSYEINVKHTISAEGQGLKIVALGLNADTDEQQMENTFLISAEDAAKLGISEADMK